MVNFGIITISHKRTKVLELFLASIQRLRKELEIYIPVVVVGDKEHKELCDVYFVEHIAHENHPASRKWNRGVDYMMSIGVDYIVILGSDDICSTSLVKNLMTEMEKETDLIGINTIYFYAAEGRFKGKLRKLTSTQYLGVARTIHRRIIEKTGVLWTREKSWGMDGDCMRNIVPHVRTRAIVEGVCVDVKTQESLNKITFWMGKIPDETPPAVFYDILSEKEKQIISEI